ncbi:MAG: PilZ domain-containing protein, partial [Armatimonadota bacterium]
MASLWRPTRRKGLERRKFPRIPLAVPVRYATDQANVGVGVLIDIHSQGAGLLVPHIAADAVHIWMQFLWFDDGMGTQGRVGFVRGTPDGFHIGVGLHPVDSESTDFVNDILIPYGLRKFKHDRKHPLELLDGLPMPRRDAKVFRQRWRYRPVLVEQGTLKVWAVAEDRNAVGAVLLLPHLLQAQACLNITPWGSFVARRATVIRSTTL